MTRNTKISGYTELDILMFQAGAPTRFDSPYWTKREIDWGVVWSALITPISKLALKLHQLIASAVYPAPNRA